MTADPFVADPDGVDSETVLSISSAIPVVSPPGRTRSQLAAKQKQYQSQQQQPTAANSATAAASQSLTSRWLAGLTGVGNTTTTTSTTTPPTTADDIVMRNRSVNTRRTTESASVQHRNDVDAHDPSSVGDRSQSQSQSQSTNVSQRQQQQQQQHQQRSIQLEPLQHPDMSWTDEERAAPNREQPVEEDAVDANEQEDDEDEEMPPPARTSGGAILEAAFVDPAYSWPPRDGEGRNAIELQASLQLLESESGALGAGDSGSVATTESLRQRMRMPAKPTPKATRMVSTTTTTTEVTETKTGWWRCCRNNDAVAEAHTSTAPATYVDKIHSQDERDYQAAKVAALEARDEYEQRKLDRHRQKERLIRKQNKYSRVPEGILIYRLDTSNQTIKLMSAPHSQTNLDSLMEEMHVVQAMPSQDKSRRGMVLVDDQGHQVTLVACEQRTATAWLEAMSLMFAKQEASSSTAHGTLGTGAVTNTSSRWASENLQDSELRTIEDQYLNLAHYSHKLIRAGALPGGKKGSGGTGGIYYTIEKVNTAVDGSTAATDPEEEALEAIAKRRAVIKDSWDFYRMICSLLRDRNKYDEVFRKMQLDPVYPYLNSMTGLNDPGDAGYENLDKTVVQKDLPQYSKMTKMELANALITKAESAMPSLVEICKALAGSLGMEEVGVGPIKEVDASLRKAEKKYGGDLLKVTDYCRALLVVKDFPSLLALLELARDSFGPLIRRVKMSTLKADHRAKHGGYRDCIINVELKEHICEIQIHLWPMWVVCGVDGFRHYRHCLEYNTDSFEDAYDALDGLDRKTMAELIVMAEEAVAETPLDNLEWYHEKFILDYFAEVGLFMKHGLDIWAEITLRHLIRLRTESPDIGPDHHETIILYRYLSQTLRAQGKYDEAAKIMVKVRESESAKKSEKDTAEKSLWDSFACVSQNALDMIVDPNRKEREEEEKLRREVKASKRHWRQIRHERFAFLDADLMPTSNKNDEDEGLEEKKVGDSASFDG